MVEPTLKDESAIKHTRRHPCPRVSMEMHKFGSLFSRRSMHRAADRDCLKWYPALVGPTFALDRFVAGAGGNLEGCRVERLASPKITRMLLVSRRAVHNLVDRLGEPKSSGSFRLHTQR